MFCCGDWGRPRESYQVIRKNEENETIVSYVPDLKTLQKGVTEDKNVKIRPVRMSDYAELHEQCKKNKTQFQDISFPPNSASLGNVQGVKAQWKRISEFLTNQTLFDDKIEPNDVIHNNVGDCYLLSSIAALAENPEIIKTIFHGQAYNKEGIYRVVLSVDGIIQEIVVDDYIPLNQFNAPIFCQPKTRVTTTEIWTLILEKALAKVKGSYANIMEGSPSEIFRIVTYCPAQSLLFDDNDQEKIWQLMKNCSGYCEPFCATTKDTLSKYSGLIPEHTYTLNAVAALKVKDLSIGDLSSKKTERIVKLRNPWAKSKEEGWKGRAGNEDREFWDGVQASNELTFIRRPTLCGDYGIFYMTFQDFCKNFNQIHYCNFHHNGKTVTQEFAPKSQKGSYFDIFVDHPALYTIEVNQSTIEKQTKQQRKEEGACRASLILLANQGGKCVYRGGTMKQNQDHLMLTQQLEPGHYIAFVQIDPTRMTNLYPDSTNISVHSSSLVKISPAEADKYKTSLHDAFLTDGLKYQKKMVENGGLMTISYRLLFQQGGYGYIVFHNEKTSDKSFVVNYSPEQFDHAHLQVIEPAQHDKNFQMKVTPGKDLLILAKAKNQKVESWKFPPKMNVKLEPLF